MQDPQFLRPPDVLLRTVSYLLDDIVSKKDFSWTIIYDFVMDRLRSVRQDMIIQNLPVAHSICILQPIVRFHAYAAYRLCEEPQHLFDPVINTSHLQECLKRLLTMYDDCCTNNIDEDMLVRHLKDVRPEFEAMYILLNLGNSTALTRALRLPTLWRTSIVRISIDLSLNYLHNNFVRVCRMMKELQSPLLAAVTSLHLPEIRRKALKIMSTAYNCKNLTFPLETLQEILIYDDSEHIARDCEYYGLKCESNVSFIKNDFLLNKTVLSPAHVQFVDNEFSKRSISNLIL
ncbi:germinal-center associated nuclear protein isoform X2 [Cylas formicarius]|nr:germinal-center associated nuclear protein isoform X2 [Cylas formicarius]XP_060524326.1 germinal-center associated nuclear protein isoform X2 [Cylas formicarius]